MGGWVIFAWRVCGVRVVGMGGGLSLEVDYRKSYNARDSGCC